MMEIIKTWQEKAIGEAKRTRIDAIQDGRKLLKEKIKKIMFATQVKLRIINCLREKPYWIMGTEAILIKAENHKLVHDIVKELGITFKKVPEYDGFNYRGDYNGININVYGIQHVANCRIISHKEWKEKIVYESVCE